MYLGGFASQLLVKTAETDLYPFQPDLLIFHVYGAHDKYEDIIRRTRERTTAEILLQNDHVTKPEDFTEDSQKEDLFTFKLTGSKTGADGEGRSDARFVSWSERVVIETDLGMWLTLHALLELSP